MEQSFKTISIIGRLAYGAVCLENALKKFNIIDETLQAEVISLIWSFTTSTQLNSWDELISQIRPLSLFDTPNQKDYLTRLYKSFPTFLVDMIENVIEIGACNLYGSTGEYSPCSLNHLMTVVEQCRLNGISLPDIIPFTKSKYSENHGWGLSQDRSFFVNS